MTTTMADTDKLEIRIMKLIEDKINSLEASINKRFDDLDAKVVSRKEFEPVRNLVYGGVGIVMTSMVIALLSLIVK